MFEEYTPEARRCMFFARAASRGFGFRAIESEHLLLGLAREDIALINRFLSARTTESALRSRITAKTATSATVPVQLADTQFADEAKRALAFAAEEAVRVSSQAVGIDHLLLGLLREENCAAARLLRELGADITSIRTQLAAKPYKPPPKEERMLRELDEIRKILAEAHIQTSEDLPAPRRKDGTLGRYTVKADRLIFFAKYAASRLGSPVVQTEHLLLSVLREERARLKLFLPLAHSSDAVCKQIEQQITAEEPVVPTKEFSVPNEDLPVSEECKRVLNYAEEEAGLLGSERIAPEHLILGMLREKDSYAARFLGEYGAEIERIRQGLAT